MKLKMKLLISASMLLFLAFTVVGSADAQSRRYDSYRGYHQSRGYYGHPRPVVVRPVPVRRYYGYSRYRPYPRRYVRVSPVYTCTVYPRHYGRRYNGYNNGYNGNYNNRNNYNNDGYNNNDNYRNNNDNYRDNNDNYRNDGYRNDGQNNSSGQDDVYDNGQRSQQQNDQDYGR